MKRVFVLSALILVLLAPAIAQRGGRQLSSDDQSRFDSYFSRWQDYQRTNDRREAQSMEKRMQSIYRRYRISNNTPYAEVASGGRDRNSGWDRWADWDRYHRAEWESHRDRDRDYWHQNQHLSGEDQDRFDSYFQRWLDYRRTDNRDEVGSMERRMFDVYDHYSIPHDVPFERVASRGGRR